MQKTYSLALLCSVGDISSSVGDFFAALLSCDMVGIWSFGVENERSRS